MGEATTTAPACRRCGHSHTARCTHRVPGVPGFPSTYRSCGCDVEDREAEEEVA